MKQRILCRLAIIVVLSMLSGMQAFAEELHKVEVTLSSPDQCEILGKKIRCMIAAEYLRNTLKVSLDSEVTVTWSFYKDQHKYSSQVANQLKTAGFKKVWCIGFEEDPFEK